MKKIHLFILTVIFILITNHVNAQAKKAYEIVDAYIEAIGGVKKIKSIRSMQQFYRSTSVETKNHLVKNADSSIVVVSSEKSYGTILNASYSSYYNRSKDKILENKITYDAHQFLRIRWTPSDGISRARLNKGQISQFKRTAIISFSDFSDDMEYRDVSFDGVQRVFGLESNPSGNKISYYSFNSQYGWRKRSAYFDTETNLLIGSENYIGDKLTYFLFSDYKVFDDLLKMPSKYYAHGFRTWYTADYYFNKPLHQNTFKSKL